MSQVPNGWSEPGNLIALIAIGLSLLWNFINSLLNVETRREARALDHFNNNVRRPLEPAFSALESVIDTADDIIRSAEPLDKKLGEVESLRSSFHSARRALTRKLADMDNSSLIDGNRWSLLDEGEFDIATEAFDSAAASRDDQQLNEALASISTVLESLRARIGTRLDECAKKFM